MSSTDNAVAFMRPDEFRVGSGDVGGFLSVSLGLASAGSSFTVGVAEVGMPFFPVMLEQVARSPRRGS
jgi:hypothetical protein